MITPDNELKNVYFYYPCTSTTKINRILELANKSIIQKQLISLECKLAGIDSLEAGMSIKPNELKRGNLSEILAYPFYSKTIKSLVFLHERIIKDPLTYNEISNNSTEGEE